MPPQSQDDENTVNELSPGEKYILLKFLEGYMAKYRFSPEQFDAISKCVEVVVAQALQKHKDSTDKRIEKVTLIIRKISDAVKSEAGKRDKADSLFEPRVKELENAVAQIKSWPWKFFATMAPIVIAIIGLIIAYMGLGK